MLALTSSTEKINVMKKKRGRFLSIFGATSIYSDLIASIMVVNPGLVAP